MANFRVDVTTPWTLITDTAQTTPTTNSTGVYVLQTYVETRELRRSSSAKGLVKVAHKGSGDLVGRHGDG
jgi:hypothetical protein